MPENPPAFHIRIEISQHVPLDHVFYVLYGKQEMAVGLENLQKTVVVMFNEAQSFMDRRLKDGVNHKGS